MAGAGLLIGAIAATAVSAGASAYAASEQASAQEDANNANIAQARDTNELNYKMFRQSRGEGGNAFLPIYAKGEDGKPLEMSLLNNLRAGYDAATAMSPAARLAEYQSALAATDPAFQSAMDAGTGLFTGEQEAGAIRDLQPVMDAKNEAVKVRAAAGNEALQEALNAINETQRRRGFSGDSTGSQKLTFDATRGIKTQQATDQAAVNIENAGGVNAIRNQARLMRIQNPQIPGTLSKLKMARITAPEDALMDQSVRRVQMFDPFRIGTSQFTYRPLPDVQPVAGIGQIVGQGVGQVAGAAGNYLASSYLAQNQQANNMEILQQMHKNALELKRA